MGALGKTQGCVSQVLGEPGANDPPAEAADPKPQHSETPRAAPAPAPCRYSLLADTSPARAPAAAAQHAVCNDATDAGEDAADADAAPSPACALLAAAAPSTETSRAGSAANSGQSAAAPPAAVVDSVLAVAALRRSNLRYRSSYAARGTVAGDVGRGGRTQIHIKIPHLDPRDLRPDLVTAVIDSLRAYDSGLLVAGAYVRRGCVELTLDLVECAAAAADDGSEAAATAAARRDLGGGGGGLQLDDIALSASVLTALQVLPSPPPAAGGGGGEQPAIMFQRGSARWRMVWDADAEEWQQRDDPWDGGSAAGGAEMSAPMAVHAATQLAPAAGEAGRGALRLAVGLRMDGGGGSAASAGALTVVAKANGRTVTVPVLSITPRQSGGAVAANSPPSSPPRPSSPSPSSSVMVLEVDLARLAAGRPEGRPGLVVRLELWRSAAGGAATLLDAVSVACLADAAAVSELLTAQRELAAAGRLDPEDEAYVSPTQQRAEAQQLLGDLGAWMDFMAAAAADPPPPPQRDSLDLSDQVAALLRGDAMRRTMLGAGLHLRQYFVYQGHVALAGAVHADLVPRLAAAGEALGDGDGGDGDEGLPLLHRAVRSGKQAMVEQVIRWTVEDGAGAACVAVWSARGAGGLTALHLLAADARCGGGAAAAATATAGAGAQPPPAEALLRWILATWPAAATVWNTVRDASGNTPSMLWAALGGQEMQVAAAAAALAREVSIDPDLPRCGAFTSAGPYVGPSGSSDAGLPPATPPPAAKLAEEAEEERPLLLQQPQLRGPAAPPGVLQLLRLSLRGFAAPTLEREYVSYVTRTTAPSVAIWLVIMVVAHVTAFFKSPNWGEGRQALIGGFAYLVSLVVMAARPRAYARHREALMLACLLGRTLCRLLLTLLPDLLQMSESVQKYVFYGIDVLLDGFMEGTFEPVRVRHALVGRLAIEWPVTAAFMLLLGVRRTYGAALLRSAAVSGAGVAMSAFTDVRSRAMFLRERRARAAGGGGGAAAAAGEKLKTS